MKSLIVTIQNDILTEDCSFGIELKDSDYAMVMMVQREGQKPKVSVDINTMKAKLSLQPTMDVTLYRIELLTPINQIPDGIVQCPCAIELMPEEYELDHEEIMDELFADLSPVGFGDDGFNITFVTDEDILRIEEPVFHHNQYSQVAFSVLLGHATEAVRSLSELTDADRILEGERRKLIRKLSDTIVELRAASN